MKKLSVSYVGHLSDRVQDLYYGRVQPEGIDLHFIPLPPFQAFNRMLRGDFHCGEMSFSTYVIKAAQKNLPFIAIPVFPSRTFRHGAIYVNRAAGISEPRQLAGAARRGSRISDDRRGMGAGRAACTNTA